MCAFFLKDKLPNKLLSKINEYIYGPKSQNFAQRMMTQIFKTRPFSQHRWKFLIRDTVNVKIQLPSKQHVGYNFASFIQQFIFSREPRAIPYFEQFCLQSISNNPQLIYNHYLVDGYKPLSAIQMIATYLVNKRIDGFQYNTMAQIIQPLYNIFLFAEKHKFFHHPRRHDLIHSLYFNQYTTNKTATTVNKILFVIQGLIQQGQGKAKQQNNIIPFDYFSKIEKFFKNMIQKFVQKLTPNTWLYRALQPKQRQYQKSKAVYWEIFNLINSEHIYLFTKQKAKHVIANVIFTADSHQLIVYLLQLNNFRQHIIFSQYFILKVFCGRRRKFCELLWSVQQKRQAICKIHKNGKNLLELVCQNYGLSHNIIMLLWRSEYFKILPKIKNKKSQQIVNSEITNNINTIMILN